MLIGTHVYLKVIDKSDVEIVRAWKNSPDVYNYFANRDFISDARQQEWYNSINKNSSSLYLIIYEKENDTPIGMTLLESINSRNRNAIWGIYIGEMKFRKKIYATEATFLILNYAYDYLNMLKISGNTLSNNERGRRFHEFIGFGEEATFHRHIYAEGKYLDLIWISMFLENWESKKHKMKKYIEEYV